MSRIRPWPAWPSLPHASFVGMGAATAKCPISRQLHRRRRLMLLVKTAQDEVKVNVPPNVMVIASRTIIRRDKKGDYLGVGATPQADGSQKATA